MKNSVKLTTAPIPIGDVTAWPVISIPEHFTEENWQDMIKMLEAMKPGILSYCAPPEPPNE